MFEIALDGLVKGPFAPSTMFWKKAGPEDGPAFLNFMVGTMGLIGDFKWLPRVNLGNSINRCAVSHFHATPDCLTGEDISLGRPHAYT